MPCEAGSTFIKKARITFPSNTDPCYLQYYSLLFTVMAVKLLPLLSAPKKKKIKREKTPLNLKQIINSKFEKNALFTAYERQCKNGRPERG